MTGAKRDPGTSANFRYTTSTDMTCFGCGRGGTIYDFAALLWTGRAGSAGASSFACGKNCWSGSAG